ncbi:MAG: hypothetical protein KGZ57_08820 [Dethiobacter sp.]|nr:hypothetical protein [Dethiobacter sp.]
MAKRRGEGGITVNNMQCKAIAEQLIKKGEEYSQSRALPNFSWGVFCFGADAIARALAQQGLLTNEQATRLSRGIVRAVIKGSETNVQAARE